MKNQINQFILNLFKASQPMMFVFLTLEVVRFDTFKKLRNKYIQYKNISGYDAMFESNELLP